MVAAVGSGAVDALLLKSIFLLGVGSNDLFVFTTELAKQNRSATQSDIAALYGSLISNYSAAITVRIYAARSTAPPYRLIDDH